MVDSQLSVSLSFLLLWSLLEAEAVPTRLGISDAILSCCCLFFFLSLSATIKRKRVGHQQQQDEEEEKKNRYYPLSFSSQEEASLPSQCTICFDDSDLGRVVTCTPLFNLLFSVTSGAMVSIFFCAWMLRSSHSRSFFYIFNLSKVKRHRKINSLRRPLIDPWPVEDVLAFLES